MIPKFRAYGIKRYYISVESEIKKMYHDVSVVTTFNDKERHVIIDFGMWNEEEYSGTAELIDYELMQSTGLFDKNGKEIFEGDVVIYGSSKYIVRLGQFVTYFSAYNKRGEKVLRICPGYGWYLKHSRDNFYNESGEVMDEPDKTEIIGNIHEHPHLLEAADGH